MGVNFKLAVKYLSKNKKRTISTITGISIVTILLITILLLFNTYRQYMIGLQRQDENWEVKFTEIPYEKVYGLKNNTDIKEVSLIQDIGISKELDNQNNIPEYIHLKAYNEIAMKNLGIKLIKGNYPQRTDEIVISQNLSNKYQKIGSYIEFCINDTINKYKIVGIINSTKFDVLSLENITVGAITYLDEENLDKNTILESSINYKNLYNVYEKTEEISQFLKLENKDEILEYNTDLLHYSGIWNMNSKEDIRIITVMIFFIILIVLIAIIFIYSTFNISILKRQKEFANLNSLGATKNQIFNIIIQEATLLLFFSILIGTIFSIFISKALITYVNNNVTNNIKVVLENNIPYDKVLIAILITIITTYIATIRPAIKASKMSIIMTLRGNTPKIKINKKLLKKENESIEKTLSIRNSEQNKGKYVTLICTVSISIFMFLVTQGYIKNAYHGTEIVPDNYNVYVRDFRAVEEIKTAFQQTGTINSMSTYQRMDMYTLIDDSKINETLKKAIESSPDIKSGVFATVDNEFRCVLLSLTGDDYDNYLKKLNLSKLRNNECILVNYDFSKTKYYDGVYFTNYKEGDYISLRFHAQKDGYSETKWNGDPDSIKDIQFTFYGDNQQKINYQIAKVANFLPNGFINSYSSGVIPEYIYIIVNHDTFFDMESSYDKEFGYDEDDYIPTIYMSINTNNRELLAEKLKQFENKYNTKYYPVITSQYIDVENKVEQKSITQVFLYGFIILIMSITFINIVNVVINDTNIRLKDLSTLKSIGMDKRKFNKMLFLEYSSYLGISYGIGILLSLSFIYIIYTYTNDHKFYNLQIPYIEMIITTILLMLILFSIIKYINKKINKDNIIQLIKEESI